MGSITIMSMVPCLCFSIRESMNETGYATTRQIAVAISESHIERTKMFAYCPTSEMYFSVNPLSSVRAKNPIISRGTSMNMIIHTR